jgi:hypothetical protein
MPERPVVCRVALGHGRLMLYTRHRQQDVETVTCQPLAGGQVAELDIDAVGQLVAGLQEAMGDA